MAPQVVNDVIALICAHPFLSATSLILFTPPFFPIVKFFSPLLISTALFMLALFTMGPNRSNKDDDDHDAPNNVDVDSLGDGVKVGKQTKPDGSWKDWVKSIEESSLAWMASPRGGLSKQHAGLNDENVSILQEASWVKGPMEEQSTQYGLDGGGVGVGGFMPTLMAPSELFKVESGLQRSIYSDMELGEDAPELEDVVEPVAEPLAQPVGGAVEEAVQEPAQNVTSDQQPAAPVPVRESEEAHNPHNGIKHQPLNTLQIPSTTTATTPPANDLRNNTDSPGTDLDDSSPSPLAPATTTTTTTPTTTATTTTTEEEEIPERYKFSVLKQSSGVSTPSEADTPEAAGTNLTLSGKFRQIEELGSLLGKQAHAENPEATGLLKPTTADQLEDVQGNLENFVDNENKREGKGDLNAAAEKVPPSAVKAQNDGAGIKQVLNAEAAVLRGAEEAESTEKSKEVSPN